MKRLVLTAAVVSTLLVGMTPGRSDAHGRRRGSCCETVSSCCAPAPCAAPAPVQYVTREVTCYKPQMVEKEITEVVCRVIRKEVPTVYTVQVPVITPTPRVVTVCKTVTEEVPCVYTVLVPRTVKRMVTLTTVQCIPEVLRENVPVCRTVRVPVTDECGRCTYVCQTVTEMRDVCRTVVKRVPVTREVEVCETVCDRVEKKGTRMVCRVVPVQQEVMVNVCTYRTEERKGVRIVCETVPERVTRKVMVCQMVPYTQTIQVPVCAPACESGCGGHRGGLFRRGGCCN
jgi:hypothetical protein